MNNLFFADHIFKSLEEIELAKKLANDNNINKYWYYIIPVVRKVKGGYMAKWVKLVKSEVDKLAEKKSISIEESQKQIYHELSKNN